MDLRILNWTVLKVIFRFKKLPKKVQAIVDDYNKDYHAQHPEEQH